MSHHDPAVAQDLYERRREVLDENDATDIALYGAVVEEGRSVRSVAVQSGLPTDEVERRVEYVRDQMKDALGDAYQSLIR